MERVLLCKMLKKGMSNTYPCGSSEIIFAQVLELLLVETLS